MQLSLLKTLLIIGTLAGVSLAGGDYGYGKGDYGHGYGKKHYYRRGGVIKRTILIDGCTGKPVEKSYNIGGGGDNGSDMVVDDGGLFDPAPEMDYDQPTYPSSYEPLLEDGILAFNEGYPAEDQLVDDYNYLGGGDITDDELII